MRLPPSSMERRGAHAPSGVPCHAFDGSGQTLAAFPWESWSSCAVGDGIVASDRALCLLILQLLDTVNFLHGRGSALLLQHARKWSNCARRDPV